jgi:hypothetical protein
MNMVEDAEADWIKVCDKVNDLLETASKDGNTFGVKLLAADMIAANGYIVSMRVMVDGGQSVGGAAPPEVDGSSSHVSVSSAFSSSQIP